MESCEVIKSDTAKDERTFAHTQTPTDTLVRIADRKKKLHEWNTKLFTHNIHLNNLWKMQRTQAWEWERQSVCAWQTQKMLRRPWVKSRRKMHREKMPTFHRMALIELEHHWMVRSWRCWYDTQAARHIYSGLFASRWADEWILLPFCIFLPRQTAFGWKSPLIMDDLLSTIRRHSVRANARSPSGHNRWTEKSLHISRFIGSMFNCSWSEQLEPGTICCVEMKNYYYCWPQLQETMKCHTTHTLQTSTFYRWDIWNELLSIKLAFYEVLSGILQLGEYASENSVMRLS